MSVASNAKWDEVKRAYVVDGVVMRGVHPVLSETFYPSYTYDRARYGPSAKRSKSHVGRSQDQGMSIGQLVDQQFIQICPLVRDHGMTLQHFVQPETTPLPLDVRASPATLKRVVALQKELHPYTRNILRVLMRESLEPRYAQVVVYNKAMRLATAVDLVCVRQGRVLQSVLVEIKCGFDLYIERHTKDRLRPPFQSFNDCPRNQHQLQLGITVALWASTRHVNALVQEACVIRAHETGVTMSPLQDWVRARLVSMQYAIMGEMNHHTEARGQLPSTVGTTDKVFYRMAPGAGAGKKSHPVSKSPASRKKQKAGKAVPVKRQPKTATAKGATRNKPPLL